MIKFIPTTRLYDDVGEQYFDLVKKLYKTADNHFESEWTEKVEKLLAKLCDRKYAFLTTSGTMGIHIMLLAAGVKPGDKVISTSYSCPASVMPVNAIGAKSIFYDVNKFGSQEVTNIKDEAKAIVVTGLYGDASDMDKIDHPMVLHDSAQNFCGTYNGKPSPSYGAMSILSFNENKNCPIFGTYGAVLCDDDNLAEAIKLMRKNGYKNREVGITHRGIGAQPHEDKALQIYCSLQHLDRWQARRKQIHDYLTEELTKLNVTVRPTPDYNSVTSYHKFAIFVNDKREFRDKIKEHGVECQVHYTNNFARSLLISDNPRDMYYTDKYVQHALTIPSSPWLTDAECETVIDKIKLVMNKNDQGVMIDG